MKLATIGENEAEVEKKKRDESFDNFQFPGSHCSSGPFFHVFQMILSLKNTTNYKSQ